MRMEDTHRLAHNLGALGISLVVLQAHLVQRVQDAPMHRLQSIANIRQRPPHDDRHRVGEIRTAHLLFNIDRDNARRAGRPARSIRTVITITAPERKQRIFIICHSWVPYFACRISWNSAGESRRRTGPPGKLSLSPGTPISMIRNYLRTRKAEEMMVTPMLSYTCPGRNSGLRFALESLPVKSQTFLPETAK